MERLPSEASTEHGDNLYEAVIAAEDELSRLLQESEAHHTEAEKREYIERVAAAHKKQNDLVEKWLDHVRSEIAE